MLSFDMIGRDSVEVAISVAVYDLQAKCSRSVRLVYAYNVSLERGGTGVVSHMTDIVQGRNSTFFYQDKVAYQTEFDQASEAIMFSKDGSTKILQVYFAYDGVNRYYSLDVFVNVDSAIRFVTNSDSTGPYVVAVQ